MTTSAQRAAAVKDHLPCLCFHSKQIQSLEHQLPYPQTSFFFLSEIPCFPLDIMKKKYKWTSQQQSYQKKFEFVYNADILCINSDCEYNTDILCSIADREYIADILWIIADSECNADILCVFAYSEYNAGILCVIADSDRFLQYNIDIISYFHHREAFNIWNLEYQNL